MRNDDAELKKLLALIPPPASPRFATECVAWTELKARFGAWLPDFIPMLASRYGSGEFQDTNGAWLRVYNPFAPDFLHLITQSSEIFNEVYSEDVDFPYKCYPSPGGLFPIGAISGGEELYILPHKGNIGYRIVHDEKNDIHDPTCHRVYPAQSFCEFLIRFLQNELQDSEYFNTLPKFIPEEPIEPVPEDDPIRHILLLDQEYRFPEAESE
jgi:hypothetical protein